MGWYHEEFQKLSRDHDADVAVYVDAQRHREHVIVEDARRMRAAPMVGSVVETELLPVRLPNPASGVGEINGYLIEVKDAANAMGQTVKLKIENVEGNLVKAVLGEPLAGASRRRRRDRGRAKDLAAGEAPIAPPTPLPRPVEAPEDGRRRPAERLAPAARRRPQDVAFSIADEEAERFPRVTVQSGRSARTEKAGDTKRRYGGRRRSGPPRRGSQEHQPLVVGGEGEIDYDDGDEDSIVTTPAASAVSPRQPLTESESESEAGRRRRRHRGRGKGRGVQRVDRPARIDADQDEAVYDGDELVVRRPSPAFEGDAREDDELDTIVDPRRPVERMREPKRFGPVRQLYGRPVQMDESRSRAEHSGVKEPTPRDRGSRSQPKPRVPARRVDQDELDVVIKPKAPAVIRVETRKVDLPPRRKGPEEDRERGPQRPRRDRGDRGERGGRGFGRSDRSAPPKPKREGPAVRQVYPPPDFEREEEPQGEPDTRKKQGMGRQPRGPLMRPADVAPVQKGKVRQLYPPPPDIPDEVAGAGKDLSDDTDIYDRVAFDEAGDEAEQSVFVSDAEELEDRRLRARERAEARRRAQDESAEEPAGSDAGKNAPFDVPHSENDEWPVF